MRIEVRHLLVVLTALLIALSPTYVIYRIVTSVTEESIDGFMALALFLTCVEILVGIIILFHWLIENKDKGITINYKFKKK